MKDALKRAAQAVGLIPTPVQMDTEIQAGVTDAALAVAEALEADEAAAAAEAALAVVAPEAVVEANVEAVTASLAELQTKFDAQATELTTALAALADSKAAMDSLTAELTAIKDANAKAAADALTAKLAAREAAITAELGSDRAAAFMDATRDMPDAQFNTIMAAMKASTTAEANQAEFTEVGVDAQADVNALQAEAASNGTAAILAAKYQKTATK
jgi:hypothetical protein